MGHISARRHPRQRHDLVRPDLFCLSVNILDLESIQLTLARTCAVIVNVPDLKAYSSVAALLLRRVTSYASSEALLTACHMPLPVGHLVPRDWEAIYTHPHSLGHSKKLLGG